MTSRSCAASACSSVMRSPIATVWRAPEAPGPSVTPHRYDPCVAFHLTVAGSLEPLAEAMGEVLSEPLADPFAPELVVVPGAGLRTWLTGRLSRVLGSTGAGDGIVANVQYVFPATLVQRALGEADALGRWSTGPLTWAVYEELCADAARYGEPGADAVRARTIADLFDRYTLHRRSMVLGWSEGTDHDGVGAPVSSFQRWQPELWRAVQARLGGPTDAQRLSTLIERLHGDEVDDLRAVLPQRVTLFGLAGLPHPHLQVLAELSRHIDVHMFAPVASMARWQQLRARLDAPLGLPVPRTKAETEHLIGDGHPLVTSWGRASREAQLLTLDALRDVPATIVAIESDASEPDVLLGRIQRDLRADRRPPGAPVDGADERLVLAPDDRSIRWHRCYGAARQVEVLRDALRHLFEETDADGEPRYQPRDVVVLTPDVTTFAPMLEAAFAGDVERGIDPIPVRVADRTLQQDDPLLDAAAALLGLLDGRFRASEVLSFLSRDPVRRRFALDGDGVERVAEWMRATNVKWGLDDSDHEAFGLPAGLRAWTFRDALDQLLLGAAMADVGPRLGIGDVVPYGDVEGIDVETAGALASFIDELRIAADALSKPCTVDEWCLALGGALRALCEVPDPDAWMWRSVERTLETFRLEAAIDDAPRTHVVEPAELAELFRIRLGASGGGRPRFGTGAVTVSSLTALRGVPFAVVCLLGLDDEVGASSSTSAEDLIAAQPCVGDRDPRSEHRAQLLDAVLAAGDRLVLLSSGHDVRTNAELAPVVALADLVDVIDATARTGTDVSASEAIAIEHPRQAWSVRAFLPGALGVEQSWSFDRAALEAARRIEAHEAARDIGDEPLPPAPVEIVDGVRIIELAALERALSDPAELLLRDRLGISLPSEERTATDHIPFTIENLDQWRIGDELLQIELPLVGDARTSADARWAQTVRRRGDVAPFEGGDPAIAKARQSAAAALSGLATGLGTEAPEFRSEPIDVVITDADGRPVRIVGSIGQVHGDTVVTVRTSRIKGKHELVAWLHLAVLTTQQPQRQWSALLVGHARPHQRLRDGGAEVALATAIDLHDRALRDLVPFLPDTSLALLTDPKAAKVYAKELKYDRWASFLLPAELADLRSLPVRPDEHGDEWGADPDADRPTRWAHRVWGAQRSTVDAPEDPGAVKDDDDD